MADADEFPLIIKNYRATCYYQRGFFEGMRWKKSMDGDKHIAVCSCGRAAVADSLQAAVDQLHDSYVIHPSGKHSHSKDAIPVPEYHILRKHSGVVVRYGRSSEDRRWWAEAREENGRFIAANSGCRTLDEALRLLGAECDRRQASTCSSDTSGLTKNPMLPEELRAVRYGLTQDLEPEKGEEDL